MKKINELQKKLIIALQQEERIMDELIQKPTKDNSKIKRCQRKIKQIHQEISANVIEQQKEIKEKISPSLWQEPQLQNYFGIQKGQKSPYTIFDIIPRNHNTIEIQAGFTPYFKLRHRNPNTNMIHNLIILKETPQGLFRYNEQELKPDDQPNTVTKKASLKIKDPNKNIYIFHVQENLKGDKKIEAKIDRYRYGLYLFKRVFFTEPITQNDLEKLLELINQVEFDNWNSQEYFNFLVEANEDISILNEIDKTKKRVI